MAVMDIAATGGDTSKASGVPFSTNGASSASSAPADPYAEIGALGFSLFGGFIQAAYNAELRWPHVQPLFERIRRTDSEIATVRMVYGTMAAGVRFECALPDKPSDDDKRFQQFATEALEDVDGGIEKWRDALVSNVPFMGWGWWEAVPGVRNPDWTPPGDDDPWRSKFDDNLIGIRRLGFRDYSAFQRWEINERTGRVLGMTQMALPNPTVTIPRNRSVHVTFGDYDNPEGLSPLEAVWRLERLKYGLEVVQGIGFEHAAGYLNVRKTEKGELTSTDKANVRAAARAILTAQEGNYAAWPFGFEGKVEDVPFSAAPSILEAIRYYGLLKLAVYNMQWIALSTISGTGSFAAVKDSSSLWLVAFNAMMSGFASQLDAQLGARLLEYNRDKFPGITSRPRITATSVEKIIELDALGAFYSQIRDIGLGPDDVLAIRRKTGFLPETLPDQKPEPAPQPTAGADPELPAEGELARRYAAARARWVEMALPDDAPHWFAELQRDYADIKGDYRETVRLAILAYLVQAASSTAFKNEIKRAATEALPGTFYAAYAVGGGEEVEPEDDQWLTARLNAELGYIDVLFQSLKGIKDEELPPRELIAEAEARADGYTRTLDGVYAQGLLRGQKNKMLTMDGADGKENCRDCRRYKGKRFSARKWVRAGIPGAPDNGYECNGYNCEHYLADDDGVRWTL